MRLRACSALASFLALSGCSSEDDAASGVASGAGGAGTATGVGPATGAGAAGAGGATQSSSASGCTDCAPCDATERTGEGTYYDADGSGNCSFDPSPEDLLVAAMNHVDYAASAVCGACVAITGPDGEVTVRIVDQCPECPAGDIDMSPEAFALIAPLEAGRVPIGWRFVPCGVVGPVVYHFKEGSNEWWTAVQIRNHETPVASFAWLTAEGTWKDVPRVDYNFFVDETGMGPGPYSFRITDVNGAVLEDTGIPFVEAGDAAGAGQFPGCAQ